MKRVYKTAAIAATESGEGYVVTLDGKHLHSPGQQPLIVPSVALAEAIAGEWAGQGPEIVPTSMPLTRLVATATDRVAAQRRAVVEELMRFADTDLLCYRATEPVALAARQAALWQPLLDWAAARFGADLAVVAGLMPCPQPDAALAALRRAVEALDDFALTGLMVATAAAGSLVIGLALIEGRISGEEAFAVSQLDETFQIEQWGEDPAATARRAALKDDLVSVERFRALRTRG
jgi:chaperone required for assembly of F1-ATPase